MINQHQVIALADVIAWLQALQCKQPLLITHRLDACTEGLLVVGRSLAFVQHFNKLLQEPGAVRKYYKALTQQPPPLGAARPHLHPRSVFGGSPCTCRARGGGEGRVQALAFVCMHAVAAQDSSLVVLALDVFAKGPAVPVLFCIDCLHRWKGGVGS